MASIDQQVSEACEYLSSMPESEFQNMMNPQPETDSLSDKEFQKMQNEKIDNRNSWLNALIDVILR